VAGVGEDEVGAARQVSMQHKPPAEVADDVASVRFPWEKWSGR
jgi:hypothetical protein